MKVGDLVVQIATGYIGVVLEVKEVMMPYYRVYLNDFGKFQSTLLYPSSLRKINLGDYK